MQIFGMLPTHRRSATLALAGALLSPIASVIAQDALPKVRLTQMVDPQWGFGSEARVRLDRDAFLIVFEFGADGRARLVYPESPRDSPYTVGGTSVLASLPSADAMFVRTASIRIPSLVALASDLAPDLSSFTAEGRVWDFDYEIPRGTTRVEMIRALAAIIYGGEDMPYSFELQELAPQLSAFAVNTLNSCGHIFGSEISPQFNSFLWQAFGPYALGAFPRGGVSPWFSTVGGGSRFGLFPLGFRRHVNSGLWGRFGAGCQPLNRQRPFYIVDNRPTPQDTPGENPDDMRLIPVPTDRDPNAPPATIPGVGITPATPLPKAARAQPVKDAVAKASDQKPLPLVRTEANGLVQRAQVVEFIRRLTIEQQMGVSPSVAAGNAWARRGPNSGSSSSGQFYGRRRASASGSGSSGVGSKGSAGGSEGSVGSGSSSGGGAGRGGSAGGGRAGSGGRTPPG